MKKMKDGVVIALAVGAQFSDVTSYFNFPPQFKYRTTAVKVLAIVLF